MPDKTKKKASENAKAGTTEKPTGQTVAKEQAPWGQDAFLQEYRFTTEEFERSGLDWAVLCEIKAHHESRTDELRSAGRYFWERLQAIPCVHSVRIRVKHPDHLIAKLIRKKLDDPTLAFTIDTYEELITDLIALRALHRFKDEWSEIHEFVISNWQRLEPIVAYVREGDEETDQFKQAGCDVKKHDHGYRSIHYLLKSQPANCLHRVELQVRTIFEEAWSEIDHVLRYPRQSFDPTLTAYLVTFNRLCGLGDEMGTYAKTLNTALRSHAETVAELERRHQVTEEELRAMVSQVEMGEKEKARIQKKLDTLQERSQEVKSARETIYVGPSLTFPNVAAPTWLVDKSILGINLDSPFTVSGNLVTAGRLHNPLSFEIAAAPTYGPIAAVRSTCQKCGKPLRAGEVDGDLCKECKK
jgi:ppGpp synthetase/RelA/SpoT-type nucleotidyltranferase